MVATGHLARCHIINNFELISIIRQNTQTIHATIESFVINN